VVTKIEPKGVGENTFPRGGIIQTEGFEKRAKRVREILLPAQAK